MSADLLVGIDFDNTIICYDRVFHRVAAEAGLIPPDLPAAKNTIRDYLRRQGKEEVWTEMQGLVYGEKIIDAESFPGIDDFLRYCRSQNIAICIVSHKTKHPYRGPAYDLHDAGYHWLASKGFLHEERTGISSRQVYFELTKEEKIERIASLKCTHFIDDLPEILLGDGMPRTINKILFDPSGSMRDVDDVFHAGSWRAILRFLQTEVDVH